jgi:hypothetical protein
MPHHDPFPTGDALHAAIASREVYTYEHFRRTGVLCVSTSVLRTTRCETEAWLAGRQARREPTLPMFAGTCVHEALAMWARGEAPAACLQHFVTRYRDAADSQTMDGDRLTVDNVSEILGLWFADRAPHFPFQPVRAAVEIPFAVPLVDACRDCGWRESLHPRGGGAHPFQAKTLMCGQIDLMVEDEHGALYVTDHKTTGRIGSDWVERFAWDPQAIAYVWAARKHTALPVVGFVLNALQLSALPEVHYRKERTRKDGTPYKGSGEPVTCPDHHVPITECRTTHARFEVFGPVVPTEAQIRGWKRAAREQARWLQELWTECLELEDCQQDGFVKGACSWCTFREFCKNGRQPSELAMALGQGQEAA